MPTGPCVGAYLCAHMLPRLKSAIFTGDPPSEPAGFCPTGSDDAAASKRARSAPADTSSPHSWLLFRTRLPKAPAAFALVLSSSSLRSMTSGATLGLRASYSLQRQSNVRDAEGRYIDRTNHAGHGHANFLQPLTQRCGSQRCQWRSTQTCVCSGRGLNIGQ